MYYLLAYLCVVISLKKFKITKIQYVMIKILKNIVPNQIKDLVKEISETQGGHWVEKKEVRIQEANEKDSTKFNPKAARTRSFEN